MLRCPLPSTADTSSAWARAARPRACWGWPGTPSNRPHPPVAPAPTSRSPARSSSTRRRRPQIERGLELLARSQYNDGSFPGGSVIDNRGGTGGTGGWSVGVTSIAGLAMMAGGHQPGRGKYGKNVAKAVEYVASMAGGPHARLPDDRREPDRWPPREPPAPEYSHGFGALFLAEVCGMLPATAKDAKVRGALEQAVEFTVKAQNREGGWRYEPLAQFADVSVTVGADDGAARGTQRRALRPQERDGQCRRLREGLPDARRRVQLLQGPGVRHSAFARSAASLVGLYSAGIYEGREVERGLRYLQQFTPGRQFSPREILAATLLVRAVLRRPGDVDRGRRLLDHLAPGDPRRTAHQGQGERRRLDRPVATARPTRPPWHSSFCNCPTTTCRSCRSRREPATAC